MNPVYIEDSLSLLRAMISIPSLSREEKDVADLVEQKLTSWGYQPYRESNNVWICSSHWNDDLPTILLNSHVDTVRPAKAWSHDPYGATEADGKLIGLGSNDAGASVVALLCAFRHWSKSRNPIT